MFYQVSSTFRAKGIADIYLNISHFLDHFMMLIFSRQPMMPAAISRSAMIR